jgi:predicted acyl esterase
MRKLTALLVGISALALAPAARADITSVFGDDVGCTTQGDGVRFCGSTSPRSTTPTFDGVPIDVNVAFPPAPESGPDGPYPLIMVFHGYGQDKQVGNLSSMQHWLDQGYATFSMTERGFGESCGSKASRDADPSGCAAGYIRLMDDRYEVRDAQYLVGELVDEGLIEPTHIGATGGSYGGGKSMALAALEDRVMLADGSLVPWTSPEGTPMSLAAAVPVAPWTDLAYALMPNGGTLDYVADAPYRGRVGVEKLSIDSALYTVGCAFHFCAPVGTDPEADLTGWKTRIDAGEPYDGDPTITDALSELTAHHSSYYIDHSEAPAPLLILSGFTDDVFPVDEALRYYNRTKTQYPASQVSLFFGDIGHQRAQNKADTQDESSSRIDAWFGYYVKGAGATPFQGVEAFTQTCPASAPSGGPFLADDWAHMAPGEVRLHSAKPQTIEPDGGDSAVAIAFDPVVGGQACAQAPADDEPGTANYRLPPAPDPGYTLLGSPTVIAHFTLPDANSQVAARLLDVAPDGTETLVARGLWRPRVSSHSARQVFQLHANGWTFAAGHVPKLELLPKDAPYGRASNGQGPVIVRNLKLRLPVLEHPGGRHHDPVKRPAPKLVPAGDTLAGGFQGLASRR